MHNIQCPQCSQPIQYGDQQAGQNANCPRCQVLLQLPYPQSNYSPTTPLNPVGPAHHSVQNPGYTGQPYFPQRRSGARTAIILWSSIGGGVLLIIFIVVMMIAASGPGFPVPSYFVKATDLSENEKLLVNHPVIDHYLYDVEGKSSRAVYDFFEETLPSRGWSKITPGTYRKGFDEFVYIQPVIVGPDKLRVTISVVQRKDIIK